MAIPAAPLLITLLLAAAGLATAAADEPRPRTQPTRDVEVVYAVSHGNQLMSERSRWQGSTGKQRIDAPGGHGFMVSDPTADTVTMVSDATHRAFVMPRPHGPLNGGPGSFQRLGTITVAGATCTEWQVTPQQGVGAVPNQICLTDDGVMLNLRIGDTPRAKAVSVSYAPIDPQAFAIPSDYVRQGAKP